MTGNSHALVYLPDAQQKARIIEYLIYSVKWPSNSIKNDEFNLCLLGNFPDLAPFEALDEKKVSKYTIQVRKLPNFNNKNFSCEMLYVSNSESASFNKIKELFKGKPTLLISDADHFAMNGGSMNFIKIGEKVAITVNLVTLKESQIFFDLKEYSRITVIPSKEDLNE